MINVLYLLQRPKVLYETNNKIKDQTASVVSMTVTMLQNKLSMSTLDIYIEEGKKAPQKQF